MLTSDHKYKIREFVRKFMYSGSSINHLWITIGEKKYVLESIAPNGIALYLYETHRSARKLLIPRQVTIELSDMIVDAIEGDSL